MQRMERYDYLPPLEDLGAARHEEWIAHAAAPLDGHLDVLAEPRAWQPPQPSAEPPMPRSAHTITYLLGIIEVLLGARVVFCLFAANPRALCTGLLSLITWPLVMPFTGVFPSPAANGRVLDSAAVLAMIAYALVAWAIRGYIRLRHRPIPAPPPQEPAPARHPLETR